MQGYSKSSMKQAGVLILLLGLLMTTKPSLGIICDGVPLNIQACAGSFVPSNILGQLPSQVPVPVPVPTATCCQSLGQINDLATSIGINRTCVCAQAAVAEIVPPGLKVNITGILAACAVSILFNITGFPGQCA